MERGKAWMRRGMHISAFKDLQACTTLVCKVLRKERLMRSPFLLRSAALVRRTLMAPDTGIRTDRITDRPD